MNDIIFLDAASTTRPYKEVADVMYDVMLNHYGNPSSIHSLGCDAKDIIESVRDQIAEDINCNPEEIIFTSGACEANSLAFTASSGRTIISSLLEHKSIEIMNMENYCFSYVENDRFGLVHNSHLSKLLNNLDLFNKKSFVSINGANSEIGTVQDIKSIANIVHSHNGIFHVDATQLYPERRIDVKEFGIDLMSVSAQKFHGPRGIGFLYVKDGIELNPIIYGSQEYGKRGGTYNTPAIAGMGKALEITRENQEKNNALIRDKRYRLLSVLLNIPGVKLNGLRTSDCRLINNISIIVQGCSAQKLVTTCSLYGLMISAGSACSSGENRPSLTLKAIGLSDEDALSTIRITIDEFTTEEEIDTAIELLPKLIERVRNI